MNEKTTKATKPPGWSRAEAALARVERLIAREEAAPVKSTGAAPASSRSTNTVRMPTPKLPTETLAEANARAMLIPPLQAAATAKSFVTDMGETDINGLFTGLLSNCKQLIEGDFNHAQAMLLSQASALDVIFNTLARRAAANIGNHTGTVETYLRLALKAQSQCRATLETLELIRNPRSIAFVRQANIANGPQQVNNGTATPVADTRAREKAERSRNELLENPNGERLDSGTPSTAGAANPPLETLGAVDGTQDTGR
jgi:hypothetical protein